MGWAAASIGTRHTTTPRRGHFIHYSEPIEPVAVTSLPRVCAYLPPLAGWAYRCAMDHQAELRGFLTTRRARISPAEAGLTPFPGLRRVPGMRREEVAYLAGISVDYYTRLERGRVTGISEEILDAVSRALCLNATEHDHLLGLVHAMRPATPRQVSRANKRAPDRDDLLNQRVVDAINTPAYIQNSRLDVLAANPIWWKTFPHAEQYLARGEAKHFNQLRFNLLDPRAQDFYLDWEGAIRSGVGLLRDSAGRYRDDTELFTLIGELSSKSELFRALWASHDVFDYRRASKHMRHPLVGELHFVSQKFTADDAGNSATNLVIYTFEPGSPTDDAMRILANWATSEDTLAVTDADRVD